MIARLNRTTLSFYIIKQALIRPKVTSVNCTSQFRGTTGDHDFGEKKFKVLS